MRKRIKKVEVEKKLYSGDSYIYRCTLILDDEQVGCRIPAVRKVRNSFRGIYLENENTPLINRFYGSLHPGVIRRYMKSEESEVAPLEDGLSHVEYLEYCSRGSLDIYPLAECDIPRVFNDMVQLIFWMHNKLQAAHHDIKPGNFLLGDEGRIKLSDAELLGKLDTDEFIGTIMYRPPNDRVHDSIAHDLYSLGITLFELYCGDIFHKVSKEPGKDLSEKYREYILIQLNKPDWKSDQRKAACEVILNLINVEPRKRKLFFNELVKKQHDFTRAIKLPFRPIDNNLLPESPTSVDFEKATLKLMKRLIVRREQGVSKFQQLEKRELKNKFPTFSGLGLIFASEQSEEGQVAFDIVFNHFLKQLTTFNKNRQFHLTQQQQIVKREASAAQQGKKVTRYHLPTAVQFSEKFGTDAKISGIANIIKLLKQYEEVFQIDQRKTKLRKLYTAISKIPDFKKITALHELYRQVKLEMRMYDPGPWSRFGPLFKAESMQEKPKSCENPQKRSHNLQGS